MPNPAPNSEWCEIPAGLLDDDPELKAVDGQGLVDRYVLYLAPALFGGDDARGAFAGPGAPTVGELWRGKMVDIRRIGDDLRVELAG